MFPATAKIIAHSMSPAEIQLITFQLRYWRPVHAELMTHRVFSRNAGSSRARPSAKIIEQVRHEPWGPLHWGKNQPGMQANTELTDFELTQAQEQWFMAANDAADHASSLLKLGAHKQVVNRLLEPFTYIDVLVTATDYNNWYALRDHPDAYPEIRQLAVAMKSAVESSTPKILEHGEWHLPYITEHDWELAHAELKKNRIVRSEPTSYEKMQLLRKVSAARCARISYKAFDNSSSFEKDLELFNKLLVEEPLHASPAEHQATPDFYEHTKDGPQWSSEELHGNFRGWIQFRKMLPNESVQW
jgi:thymidylate synthase ThyX